MCKHNIRAHTRGTLVEALVGANEKMGTASASGSPGRYLGWP